MATKCKKGTNMTIHRPDYTTIVNNLLSWQWTENFFNWILMSGGKLASMAFLASGIWLSVYNSVRPFVEAIMPHGLPETLSYLSKTTFTALPEIILFLSALNTLDQIKLIRVSKKGSIQYKLAWTWAMLFGLPTTAFCSYALYNIASSLLRTNYEMPDIVIVLRGITCFVYGLLVFIYSERGRKCFADEIESLHEEVKRISLDLQNEREEKQIVLASLQSELQSTKGTVAKLSERASSLALQDLEMYPNYIREVLDAGVKTITPEFFSELTGLSKRKITAANLKRHSRNKDFILVSSATEWLRKQISPTTKILEIDDYMEA